MAKKILIVEDDVFLGDVLLQKLLKEGFESYLERDGELAVDKMKEIKPDLILLDIILPNKNGYEILEIKKDNPDIAAIPVIIISNSGQPVEINRALALGVKDYLVKAQFDPEEVLEKVRHQMVNSDTETKPKEDAPIVDLSGKKIMWVEDDNFLNDIITRKLAGTNANLIHTMGGQEALDSLAKDKPDIIVLDILLAGMDGYEILKKVKSDPATKDIPVIMLSNLGQKSDIDKALELGALKFFIKASVTLDEIVFEIKNILSGNK